MSAKVIPIKKEFEEPSGVWEPLLDAKGKRVSNFVRNRSNQVIYFKKKFKKLGIPELFRSTGETTIGRARTKAHLMQQQHVNQYLGVDDSHVLLKRKEKTFKDAAEKVLEDHTPEQRVGTQNNHKLYINEMIRYWGNLDVNAINVDTFKDLISKLRRTKKRKTYFDYQKAANLVMRMAYKKKWCSHLVTFPDPDKEYRNRLQNKKKRREKLTPEEIEILELKSSRVLTRKEIDALWEVMNEDTKDQFVLSFECMMRLREALHLEWDRCDPKTGIIVLRPEDVKTGSKTGKGRTFYMTPHAQERMAKRWKDRDQRSRFVFPGWSISKQGEKKVKDKRNNRVWDRVKNSVDKPVNQNKSAWNRAKSPAKIKERTRWHDLRHTALTFALLGDPSLPPEERAAQRKDPLLVSEYAGVSLRTIQAVYLKTDANATKEVSQAVKVIRL